MRLFPLSFISLAVYVIGFPTIIILILAKNRHLVQEDQLLRAQWLGDLRIENKHAYSFRKRYKRLYYNFRPQYWYWILVLMGRKFILAITSLMFIRNPGFQMTIVLLTVFVAYTLQVRMQPYMSLSERETVVREYEKQARIDYEKWVDRVLQTGDRYLKKPEKWIVWNQMQDAIEHLGQSSKASVATMSAERKSKTSARTAGQSARYIFNYNTVESVLLACSICITLGGVMFESGQLDLPSYRPQKDALAIILVLVILASIIFAGVVIVYDVVVTVKPQACQRKKDRGLKPLEDGTDKLNIVQNQLMSGVAGSLKGTDLPPTCDDPALWDAIRERYAGLEANLQELTSSQVALLSRSNSVMKRTTAARMTKVKKQYNQVQTKDAAAAWTKYNDPNTGQEYL